MTQQPNNVSAAGVPAYRPSQRLVVKELRRRQKQAFDEDAGAAADLIEKLLAENKRLLAAASAPATAPVGWFVQRSSFGPWIEVERYEDGAVRLRAASSATEPKP